MIISDMTALPCGSLQTHLGTSMPPEGGYIIKAHRVVKQSIQQRGCDHRVAEHLASFSKATLQSQDHGVLFVAGVDQLEEQVAAAGIRRSATPLLTHKILYGSINKSHFHIMEERFMLNFPSFSLRTQIRTGMAAEAAVTHELAALGAKRVLLVSDPGVIKSGIVKPIMDAISTTTSLVHVFSDVMQDPTLKLMDQIGKICTEEGVDAIVAVGGGAALDAAKGAAIVARTGESIRTAIGEDRVFVDPLPVLAVPTTAGTGSEVSWHISVNDTEDERKVTVRSPRAVCYSAILDPKMISTAPPMVTAAAGMDALTHNLEAYVGNVGRWDLTDALTLHACKMIGRAMLPHWSDPSDINAAEQMLIASCLGGIALSHSRTGIVHQMARPLGALFHVPHGLANAVLLPWCLEFTHHSDVVRYAAVAAAIGAECTGLSSKEAAAAGVARIREMNLKMGIPRSLKHFGVTSDQVERMAKDALQGKPTVSNPCVAKLEDLIAIYTQAMEA